MLEIVNRIVRHAELFHGRGGMAGWRGTVKDTISLTPKLSKCVLRRDGAPLPSPGPGSMLGRHLHPISTQGVKCAWKSGIDQTDESDESTIETQLRRE